MLPCILSLSGPTLTPEERAFFRDADPAGYILFGRNCRDRVQLRALTDELRALAGRDRLPILIDQEGGRVARLKPPVWPDFPPQWRFAQLYERAPISGMEAARVNALAIALTLAGAGINIACLPLLDVRQAGAHDVIGDRALGSDPLQVAALGRMVLDGLAAGGVAGVIKHMPGHGRARADSHRELPVVAASAAELESDLAPFRRLASAPIGMTAHILYPAWDPERPATLSPVIISQVIRASIGFNGLLLSDDIGMSALSGTLEQRANGALTAGCDLVLHCSGALGESRAVASNLPQITQAARDRLDEATPSPPPAPADNVAALLHARDALLAAADPAAPD